MYWRFVPIMQHIPCTTGPSLHCGLSNEWASCVTWHWQHDTWHCHELWPDMMTLPSNGREEHEASVTWTMRGINKDRAASCIISLYTAPTYWMLHLFFAHTMSEWKLGHIWVGKVSLSSASLSTDARPRISWLMLKPFNFTFSLCDDLRNRLMSV